MNNMQFFNMNFFFKKKEKPHEHSWEVQYRTGNAMDGKSDVVKCNCGQWAVFHRNPSFGKTHEYILITN